MSISALGAGRRGNLETGSLREAFLSHLGCQCLGVVPSGRHPMEGIHLGLQLLCPSAVPGAVALICTTCVCSLIVWICRSPAAGRPALSRTMLHPPPCKHCFLLAGCDTETHSAYIPGLQEEVSRERSSCPHSLGKLARKSQAGLRFSASGVPGMVLEVQEDKTTASQHTDSDDHCPPCTARKVLFPPTLPAESLRAHKKDSFILAASFIQCVYSPSLFGLLLCLFSPVF